MNVGIIDRLESDDKQTLGYFVFYKKIKHEEKVGYELAFRCEVLELPDKNNKPRESRIPPGVYRCVPRKSKKYGNHYHVLDVLDRTLILIHFGNFYYDTKGCILFGEELKDINRDGHDDITSSKKTMKRFLEVTGGGPFHLYINDYDDIQ